MEERNREPINSSVFNTMLTFELEQLLIALAHSLIQHTIATAFNLNMKCEKSKFNSITLFTLHDHLCKLWIKSICQ